MDSQTEVNAVGMRVVSIATGPAGEVFGLGQDNRVYRWVAQAEGWVLVGAK